MVQVSAVILTWNSAQHIGRALATLQREGERIPTEVIVVDNGSSDNSLEIVAAATPDARVVRNVSNQGVARARNQGVGVSRAPYILFLDSDTEMTPGSLATMVEFLEAHPGVAVVGPMLTYPDGRLQYSSRKFPTVPGKLLRLLPLAWRRAVPLAVDEEMHSLDRSRPQQVDYVIGACQLIRRTVMDSLGGLDERMFYGPEDVDFCLRAWRAGWEVCYIPAAIVVHLEQRITHRHFDHLTLRHGMALAFYFWKHGYFWSRPRFIAEEVRGRATEGSARGPAARPRLLELVTLSDWGGAQAYVFALSQGFGDTFDVTVACAPGGPLVPRLRAEGFRVVEIPSLVRSPYPVADLKTLWWLTRWMRRERFAIVHCHSTKAGLLGRFAARMAGVPGIVFTVHGWPFMDWRHPLMRATVMLAERAAARISTAIIFVSEHDRQLALQTGIGRADRMYVIQNGIDPLQWRPDPAASHPTAVTGDAGESAATVGDGPAASDGGCTVVSVGRLTDQKDPATLLRAWERIRQPHRLVLVGDGYLRPRLEAMVRDSMVGRVAVLGAREDVSALLRAADVFVLASRWEGLPLAVLEAMMSGLPVVATAVGGVAEAVVDGETGFLVSPQDPDALSSALGQLLDDPALRRRMGVAGQRRALEHFTETRMLRETAEVYARVLPEGMAVHSTKIQD